MKILLRTAKDTEAAVHGQIHTVARVVRDMIPASMVLGYYTTCILKGSIVDLLEADMPRGTRKCMTFTTWPVMEFFLHSSV